LKKSPERKRLCSEISLQSLFLSGDRQNDDRVISFWVEPEQELEKAGL